jgi:hypothetical protein
MAMPSEAAIKANPAITSRPLMAVLPKTLSISLVVDPHCSSGFSIRQHFDPQDREVIGLLSRLEQFNWQ